MSEIELTMSMYGLNSKNYLLKFGEIKYEYVGRYLVVIGT